VSREINSNELALVADSENEVRIVFPEEEQAGISDAQEFLVAVLTKVQSEAAFGGYVVSCHRELVGEDVEETFIPEAPRSVN
jgi:hypothetical protein